jgi:hypothetical protein
MYSEIIQNTIMITGFVLAMMLLIEYLTVQSKGRWMKPIKQKGWLQIIFASVLGLIPGCLGTYTAVTLYSHKIFGFAALVTVMIATSGDEAFIMLSVIPESAIQIFGLTFLISIIVGLFLHAVNKSKTLMKLEENHLKVHDHEPDCCTFEKGSFWLQIRKMSTERAILLTALLLFITGLILGYFVHGHGEAHLHGAELHLHDHKSHGVDWGWVRITALIASLIALFIIITVPNHFLKEHLWEHIIKKHFLRIFLWTLAALILIHFLVEWLPLKDWMSTNTFTILILAVLLGIIPESGPHILFVTLFASGNIPFSILLANSIVQDGHGALPLLAESKKSFLVMKAVNVLVGLLVGVIGIIFNF